eukprot:6308395-Karenia_brevis.AAC.1
MVPGNSFLRCDEIGLGTLAGSPTWSSIHLGNDRVLLWSGDDQKGAYWIYSIPAAWQKFMTLAWPIKRRELGLSICDDDDGDEQ